MTEYLTSGSAFERLALCPTSAALPHAHHESIYTRRGTAIHEFLENVSNVGRDAAIELVDSEWRSVCLDLNLEGLHDQLQLASEVALAYNVETDTARELGRGEGRAYDDVTIDEIPATLDVVGVRELPNGRRRALVVDWKSGWTTRRKIQHVLQLDVGALLAARAYDCDVAEVQLIHVHEDFEPWVQRRVIDGWEIDAFAAHVKSVHAEAKRQRAMLREGLMPRDFNTGPWCDHCPAREFCPAQATMLRSVLSGDLFDGPNRMQPIPDDVLIQLWTDVIEAQGVLSRMKGKILGIASQRTLHLGKTVDGQDRWLGKYRYLGSEKLDGEKVYDVVAELYGDDVATAATKVVATKKDMEAAVKKAVGRGKGAKALGDVYARLKASGGTSRTWKEDTKEYVTKQLDATAPQELLAPSANESEPE